MNGIFAKGCLALSLAAVLAVGVAPAAMAAMAAKKPKVEPAPDYLTNDSHFHLTNYIQEGITLQQQWSHRVTGDGAPTYYLDTDAPLYYYSFTDAYIAQQYLALPVKDRARFDPMITGFNPTDMYAADHIRRVLQTFPGVFSGIGEFSIHKEGRDRAYLEEFRSLLKRHPQTTIIWAHLGVGRVVAPAKGHLDIVEEILNDPAFAHVYFDLSWDQAAKYIIATPEATAKTAALINQYPDRFLFGTDEVAPPDQAKYLKVFYQYDPLWALLTTETVQKVRKDNYARLFDAARVKVRAWEKANPAGQ